MAYKKNWKSLFGMRYCKGHDDVAPIKEFQTKMQSGRVVFHHFCAACRVELEKEAKKRARQAANVGIPHELIAKYAEAAGMAKGLATSCRKRKDKAGERKAWIMYFGYRNRLRHEQKLLDLYYSVDREFDYDSARKLTTRDDEPAE